MARQKKIKSLQVEEKAEADMTENSLEVLQAEIEKTKQEVKSIEHQNLAAVEREIALKRKELEDLKKDLETKKYEYTALPTRQLDEDEIIITKRRVENSAEKAALKKVIEQQKAYDNQMVTGKFLNRRAPGQTVKLAYMKYADDPVKWYPMVDGKIYTIPRGFADQINEYYHTPIFVQKEGEHHHSDVVGENSQIASVDTSNKKYAFVPTQF